MRTTPTTFTVAEYCEQMSSGSIIVNPDYQRSSKIWPPAARSYLIDTILQGYPIPKISLYQKTDLKSRKTVKEIVDGQQRSNTIRDFFNNQLRISGQSKYSGLRYDQLDTEIQQAFIDYQITADIFVGANDDDIRQVFRRINSYTVPLNPQENRHAVYQGAFKWFVVELTEKYAQSLKDLGVFKEQQLSRMQDAKLLTEICLCITDGIGHASDAKLNTYYKDRESNFPEREDIEHRYKQCFNIIIGWEELHNGPLMKPYTFYSLFTALSHCLRPAIALQPVFNSRPIQSSDHSHALSRLTSLADAIEEGVEDGEHKEFVKAASAATNRLKQRTARFRWLCELLQPQPDLFR